MRSRRGQNQRDSRGRQKSERERPEIYIRPCLLCNEHCGNNKGDKSICRLCSEQVKKLRTKLTLVKNKLSH